MSRSLSRATLNRRSSLSQTAQSSQRFHEEVTSETNVQDMPAELQQKIVYLNDSQLEDDPYNAEVYGDADVRELTRAMNEYGFQGVILAYPIGNGKYRIESGHRRRAAAKEARIKEYPVFITESPKTEYERKIRLFLGNLHSRDENPMMKARVAEGLYLAHKQEMKDKKKAGLLQEGEPTFINDIVARDMEINTAHVGRLRALLKLTPKLQSLAASKDYSWTDLSAASTLDEAKQDQLYQLIVKQRDKRGEESVNRAFLQRTITQLKEDSLSARKKENAEKRAKNNYARMIAKGTRLLTEALAEDAVYRREDIPEVTASLRELQKKIQKKLDELAEGSTDENSAIFKEAGR